MKTRQATKWMPLLLTLLATISCASPNQPLPTSTPEPPTPTPQPTLTPPSPIYTSIPEQPDCLTLPGRLEPGTLESTKPAQEYFIYLPPCYDEQALRHYPVLYLLHGQTYTADQWIRLGATAVLDELISAGEMQPFIVVFPDDRYWNLESGNGFGDRLVNELIPHIDETYRTINDREHRAIGGMSRGAGWSLKLGLTHWDLFSVIGLHSLAVFQRDGSKIGKWLKNIPPSSYPVVYMDIGDKDPERAMAVSVEEQFTEYGLPHEWHLYTGVHTEEYWSAHVREYLKWYAGQWNISPAE
jgi:enterochelin esterase-like enzyme